MAHGRGRARPIDALAARRPADPEAAEREWQRAEALDGGRVPGLGETSAGVAARAERHARARVPGDDQAWLDGSRRAADGRRRHVPARTPSSSPPAARRSGPDGSKSQPGRSTLDDRRAGDDALLERRRGPRARWRARRVHAERVRCADGSRSRRGPAAGAAPDRHVRGAAVAGPSSSGANVAALDATGRRATSARDARSRTTAAALARLGHVGPRGRGRRRCGRRGVAASGALAGGAHRDPLRQRRPEEPVSEAPPRQRSSLLELRIEARVLRLN